MQYEPIIEDTNFQENSSHTEEDIYEIPISIFHTEIAVC